MAIVSRGQMSMRHLMLMTYGSVSLRMKGSERFEPWKNRTRIYRSTCRYDVRYAYITTFMSKVFSY